MHDPEKYSPQKLDIKRIQEGLSNRQMSKIQYECDLLRMDIQKLLYVAAHLFNEGVTASNTKIIETVEKIHIHETEITKDSYDSGTTTYETYGDDYSYYSPA